MCRDTFPLSGHLFIFFSKRCDRVRIVYWDRNGYAMWTKRLEKGRFRIPRVEAGATRAVLDATELTMLLDGIDLSRVKRVRPANRVLTRRWRAA